MSQKRFNQEFKQTGSNYIKPSFKTVARNSKKGYDHIREKIEDQELIDHIQKESEHHPIQLMCRVLKLPRSTYYDSFYKQPNSYHVANEQLLKCIRKIHLESKGRYGATKITRALEKEGHSSSLNRVQL